MVRQDRVRLVPLLTRSRFFVDRLNVFFSLASLTVVLLWLWRSSMFVRVCLVLTPRMICTTGVKHCAFWPFSRGRLGRAKKVGTNPNPPPPPPHLCLVTCGS